MSLWVRIIITIHRYADAPLVYAHIITKTNTPPRKHESQLPVIKIISEKATPTAEYVGVIHSGKRPYHTTLAS